MSAEADPRQALGKALGDLEARLRFRCRMGGTRLPLGTAERIVALTEPLPIPGTGGRPEEILAAVAGEIRGCTRCALGLSRRTAVPGEGDPRAPLVFVGEGPGEEEDLQGRPFVGAAGQLLEKIIRAMGLAREEVFIANAVKCRPPRNRTPRPEEIAACRDFLLRQIRAVSPRVVVTLGAVATAGLLEAGGGISRIRGRFQQWEGIAVMPTYHPSYLLRNPERKREVWEDMKQVMALLHGA